MQVQLCAALHKLCFSPTLRLQPGLLRSLTCINSTQDRKASFFQRLPAHDLWKSISVVSNAGMKRGRGRKSNFRVVKDLYKDTRIGDGGENMLWPGLNTNVIKGKDVAQQEKIPEGLPGRAAKAEKLGPRRTPRIHPLDRGYTSATICGRSLVGTQLHLAEGFDYRALVQDNVSHMTGLYGRLLSTSMIVACGNGNGILGFGIGRSRSKMTAAQKGATKATKRLMYIERFNNHTVLHDFFSQYYATKLFVSKKPEGFGLRCHRVIATICRLVGIKDIHAKVEGSTLNANIVKAFILGLIRQRRYEEFAEEKQLHLVEFDPSCRSFPKVLASPSVCRTKDEIPSSEILDFTQFALGDRVVLRRPKYDKFYTKLPGWEKYLHKMEYKRGAIEQTWEMKARHGKVKSYFTDKYPECVPPLKSCE